MYWIQIRQSILHT